MKVLGIVGSPRKNGNCDVLVKEFLEAVDADTEYIFLNEKELNGCNACMGCVEGDCVIDDDGNEIIKALLDADVLVFSSPIYYGQITAQAKSFIDRFYQISRNPEKTLEGKKVVTIFTQAQPENVFGNYIESFKTMPFGFMGMEVVGNVTAMGTQNAGDEEELQKYIDEVKAIAAEL
ncbi:flavodoxin family protein [Methanosphaera sp. ISO3-F5]|uniref:flavodoxin family protein n=1 Tax=Methanosphaera sp. ISO3-F5 TaxID=1452353 RepID=UPI002B25BCDE|nr:flavodoxin family protein [Methanosphaera sp. ISO3-F5]WQH63932.1 flavodoxin family protein [Methanosphaera sp. ISO3-F5]